MSIDSDVSGTVVHAEDAKANEQVDIDVDGDEKIYDGNKEGNLIEVKLSDLKRVGPLG